MKALFLLKISALYADEKASHFLGLMLIFGISTGLFTGVLNNYLHEILHISKVERGMIELPRELPGLLLIFIIAMLYRFSEVRILRIAVLISLAGIAGMTLYGTSRLMAIGMIVLWSTGEHMMMPVRQSLGVHMAQKGREGLALGAVRSMTNFGQLIGYYLIPLIFIVLPFHNIQKATFPYFRLIFMLMVVTLTAGLILSTRLRQKNRHIQRKRLHFSRKFTKYYILEVFFGARKQVFLTFAPYVLIVQYGAQTETLALLYGLFSTINIFAAPLVGRLIDRLGYRIVIIMDTILLIVLCLLYGFAHHLLPRTAAFFLICGVFIFDSVLFVVSIARTMYVKQISDNQNEVTSTLTTGTSINHFISILIAIAGGLLWEHMGIEVLFTIAALFGLGSFFFSLTIPKENTGTGP